MKVIVTPNPRNVIYIDASLMWWSITDTIQASRGLRYKSEIDHIYVVESLVIEKDITEQKMKFSIKDIFSKCDQIRSKPRIWSHLLKKSLTENFIFCAAITQT